jgi:hypothetical protein
MTGGIPEQTPMTWPNGAYPGRVTLADRVAFAKRGFPTVVDGDALAIARGDMARIVTVVR